MVTKKHLDDHGQPLVRNYHSRRLVHRNIDELIGICKGVISDGVVNEDEVFFLTHWLEQNNSIANEWPANIIYARIEKIMEDSIVDENEKKELFSLLKDITGGVAAYGIVDEQTGEIHEGIADMSTALPLDKPPPKIVFNGKLFCLTGRFLFGSRNNCELEITHRGGEPLRNPTKKTNYLIIGTVGSRDWLHSTHGIKIKHAVELKKKGHPLAIVSEEHWLNFLGL